MKYAKINKYIFTFENDILVDIEDFTNNNHLKEIINFKIGNKYKFDKYFTTYEQAFFDKFLENHEYLFFENGFTGLVKTFEKNILRSEFFQINGRKEGIEKIYNDNNKVVCEYNYVNNQIIEKKIFKNNALFENVKLTDIYKLWEKSKYEFIENLCFLLKAKYNAVVVMGGWMITDQSSKTIYHWNKFWPNVDYFIIGDGLSVLYNLSKNEKINHNYKFVVSDKILDFSDQSSSPLPEDYINFNESLMEEAKSETTDHWWNGNLNFKGAKFEAMDAESPINGNKFVSFSAFIKLLNQNRVKFTKQGAVDFNIDITNKKPIIISIF